MRRSKGFTLIEVVISIAILAVVTVALFSVLTVNFQINARASARQQVNMLQQQWMETVRMYTGPDLSELLPSSEWEWLDESENAVSDGALATFFRREFLVDGKTVVLEIEQRKSDGIDLSLLPECEYTVSAASGADWPDAAELTIDSTFGVLASPAALASVGPLTAPSPPDPFRALLFWTGLTPNRTITVSNPTDQETELYIVRRAGEGTGENDYMSFPAVNVSLGRVTVHNQIVYPLNEAQQYALTNADAQYLTVYEITVTAYFDEGESLRKYSELESTRIVR